MSNWKMTKIPRKGTRRRAVFNLLYSNEMVSEPTYWAEAKDAYDNHPPAYSPAKFGPRYYSGMELSRILNSFADRIHRGLYRIKPEWKQAMDVELGIAIPNVDFPVKGPFQRPEAPAELKPIVCSCGAYTLGNKGVVNDDGFEHHTFEWCKSGKTVTASIDLSEGSLIAIVKQICKDENIPSDLEEDLLEAARMAQDAQQNLNDAAKNFAEAELHFEALLRDAKTYVKEK